MKLFAMLVAPLVGAGLMQALAGALLVRRFRARAGPVIPGTVIPGARPAMTVLKPLFGAEPLLDEALASLCLQDYDRLQIVFGVQDPRDPAVATVQALQARFPSRDIVLVVDPTPHGRNHKVANLINMMPAARHDVIVIADSDVHVRPDYLARLADALCRPGVGLVTALYGGLPASGSVAGLLGATWITHGFLPGALMARALGRRDCLGATMALRRETLGAVGGLAAIADEVADDAMLGRKVRALGLEIALADTVLATTVAETRVAALFSHELRWARTIRTLAPVGFVLSGVQHPLAWALLCVILAGGAAWAWALLGVAWLARAAHAFAIDRALGPVAAGLPARTPAWLLPARDALSVIVMLASYLSGRVRWRGKVLDVQRMQPDMMRLDAINLGTERP